jgi:hypothetical protein
MGDKEDWSPGSSGFPTINKSKFFQIEKNGLGDLRNKPFGEQKKRLTKRNVASRRVYSLGITG